MKFEDFCIVHTGPSVIPTYLPSLRIWHYNTTEEIDRFWPTQHPPILAEPVSLLKQTTNMWEGLWDVLYTIPYKVTSKRIGIARKKSKKRKKGRKKKPPIPRLPRYFSADSPSRTNRYLSPLGYTQYYLPLHQHENPNWTVEYITYPYKQIKDYNPDHMQCGSSVENDTLKNLSFNLSDLTIPSWLSLAKRLTNDGGLWKTYVRRMYVSSGAED